MFLIVDGTVTQSYYKQDGGRTYFTVADADTLTNMELTSSRLQANDVAPYVDQRGRVEMRVKVTKFQGADRLECLSFKFTPQAAAQPEPSRKSA